MFIKGANMRAYPVFFWLSACALIVAFLSFAYFGAMTIYQRLTTDGETGRDGLREALWNCARVMAQGHDMGARKDVSGACVERRLYAIRQVGNVAFAVFVISFACAGLIWTWFQ